MLVWPSSPSVGGFFFRLSVLSENSKQHFAANSPVLAANMSVLPHPETYSSVAAMEWRFVFLTTAKEQFWHRARVTLPLF